MIEKTMILKEINELTTEYLERKHELERLRASQEELNVLESEIKFKVSVLLHWLDYSLIRQ